MKRQMKKICATITALSLGMTLTPGYTQAAAKPKLSKSKMTLSVGQSATLKVKGTTKKVTWSTSNKKVAKVTKKGKVTALKKGTANITAKVAGKKLICKLTVTKRKKPITTQKPVVTPVPDVTGTDTAQNTPTADPVQNTPTSAVAATEIPGTQVPATIAPTQTPAPQDITMVTMPPGTTHAPSGATTGTSGIYDTNGTKLYTWAQLLENQTITVTNGRLTHFDKSKCAVEKFSILIDPSVQVIGEDAFVNCDMLRAVTLPDTLTSIENNAFYNCTQLEAIHIPANLQSIGMGAFGYCCGLTSIQIPSTVTFIGERAFEMVNNVEYYGSLKDLNDWGSKNRNGYVEGQIVYRNAEKKILCGVSANYTGEFVVPDTVTLIGAKSFYSCDKITGIHIPDSVTSIEQQAFMKCERLKQITLPEGVRSVETATFMSCSNLQQVIFRGKLEYIEQEAFANCHKLGVVQLPEGITYIGPDAFTDCYHSQVTVPGTVKTIEDNAFTNICNLLYQGTLNNDNQWGARVKNGYIEDQVVYTDETKTILIGVLDTNIQSFTVPCEVTCISSYAFCNCAQLTQVTLPAGLQMIGTQAFGHCEQLTGIVLPGQLKTIGDFAFAMCTQLSVLTVPDTVQNIGILAFMKVPSVTYHGDAEGKPWGALVLNGEMVPSEELS